MRIFQKVKQLARGVADHLFIGVINFFESPQIMQLSKLL